MDEKKTRSVSLEEADRMSGGSVVAPRPDRMEEKKEPAAKRRKGAEKRKQPLFLMPAGAGH